MHKYYLSVLFSLVILSGCAVLNEALQESFEKPRISFADTQIESLSFEAIGLAFDLKVENPNPISVSMAGYDYDFLLNNRSFITGEQQEKVEIKAEDANIVRVPVTLSYKNIYDAVSGLAGRDEAPYRIELGCSFELPVFGLQRIPVTHSGTVPLLRLPKVKVADLQLNNLSVSGANLVLQVEIDNPNKFDFLLQNIKYSLTIADQQWLNGAQEQDLQVASNGKGVLEFPIKLNFFEVGRSVFGMLTGDSPLSYHLTGQLGINPNLSLINEIRIPFDQTGEIAVRK